MSNVNMPKWQGAGKSAAKSYDVHGYDKNGKAWKKKNHSFTDMQNYTSGNDSETGYNRRGAEYRTKSHASPFADDRRGNRDYEGDYYSDDNYSNAAFEDNNAPDLSGPSGASAKLPEFELPALGTSESKSNWSIRNESGMQLPVSIMFSGAPVHFASLEAPVTRCANAQFRNTTVMTFDEKALATSMRSSSKAATLTSAEAVGIAQNAVNNGTIIPLGMHVGSYHNPFSFPVGVRSSHEPLNQIVSRSGQKFMVVLLPGTHNADFHVNVRDTLNQSKLINASRLTDVKPESFMVAQTAGSPYVLVEKNSMLHSGITVASQRNKCVPVNWNNVKEEPLFNKTYLANIPRAAAEYAIGQIKITAKQNHGSQPLSKVAFSIHPLNFQEKWDGHHLSAAGYDVETAKEAYQDFLNRPVDIVVNGTIEYL